jgi:hypothetical protein
MTPWPFFGPSKMNSGGRSRFSQTRVSFGCANVDGAWPARQRKIANAHNARPPRLRQRLMGCAIKRLSLDGPVFAQLCDLFHVVTKIVEYLRIVFAQLRPDPFRSARCL